MPTKEKKTKLKEIAEQISTEIKSLIKERFNYEIPIANVQKAGIDTLGNECENQLIEVLQEFKNISLIIKCGILQIKRFINILLMQQKLRVRKLHNGKFS